ncbi:MAG: aromatic amino acid transport family protein [Candidatus Pacebacteria bacterium]|nr:aromatic amino acid transport family protein [Candidatus Paceibacterota bacterium]
MKKIVYSVAILSGTIIGVGLFALPYITVKAGVWLVLGYFVLLSLIAYLVHYLFAELALHTPDFKRLPGFAQIYLGSWGKRIA